MWGFFVTVDTQIDQYGSYQYTVTKEMIENAKKAMLLQSPLINIEYNSDAMLLRISNHFFQIQCIYFRIPTRIKCYSSGI